MCVRVRDLVIGAEVVMVAAGADVCASFLDRVGLPLSHIT
jgi:hypothetical protein